MDTIGAVCRRYTTRCRSWRQLLSDAPNGRVLIAVIHDLAYLVFIVVPIALIAVPLALGARRKALLRRERAASMAEHEQVAAPNIAGDRGADGASSSGS